MKFKLLRRRMSISAPKMTVRTHIPWPTRILVLVLVLGISAALGMWIYDAGKRFAGFDKDLTAELPHLREQIAALTSERDKLQSQANAAESRLNIERAAQAQMGNQIKSLEFENGKLKEDIAFFENLSADGPVNGLAVRRLQVEADSVPQQMRYRMLVVQGGKTDHDFVGDLQLILTLAEGGKTVIINLPDNAPGGDPKAYQVAFRFYKRIEGTFRIPADASLKQLQVRILERGTVRAQQTALLK